MTMDKLYLKVPFLGHFVAFLDKFKESSNFYAAPLGSRDSLLEFMFSTHLVMLNGDTFWNVSQEIFQLTWSSCTQSDQPDSTQTYYHMEVILSLSGPWGYLVGKNLLR